MNKWLLFAGQDEYGGIAVTDFVRSFPDLEAAMGHAESLSRDSLIMFYDGVSLVPYMHRETRIVYLSQREAPKEYIEWLQKIQDPNVWGAVPPHRSESRWVKRMAAREENRP